MRYLFLEKNNIDNKYNDDYQYFCFITDNKDLDYKHVPNSEKHLITFKDINFNNSPFSFKHNSPVGFETVFGDIFSYICNKNLLNKKILKFKIEFNEIKETE